MSAGAAPVGQRVFSIPSGVSFTSTFAQALLRGEIVPAFPKEADTLALASATIFVPTRRAARALELEFLKASGRRAALLPNIVTLGRIEALEPNQPLEATARIETLGVAPEFERRLALATLVRQWAMAIKGAIVSVDEAGRMESVDDEPLLIGASLASAWTLAGELGSLIDEFVIEGIEWTALERLNPAEFDRYWGITYTFLKIAAEAWPGYLREHGLEDGAERQARLLDSQIQQLARDDMTAPLIVAGSTGANAATSRLIAAVARRPNGAVVLPDVDLNLDGNAWSFLAGADRPREEPVSTHPQSAIARLLAAMKLARSDIVELGRPSEALAARRRVMSEAMRPAETTDEWRLTRSSGPADWIALGLDGVAVMEAADEREEALCIALQLRECLETPGETAALITPDRSIARRVRAHLARWGVDIDDSAGEPLGRAPHGAYARLLLAAADPSALCIDLIALLTHPLAGFDYEHGDFERRVRHLNIGLARLALDFSQVPARLVADARAAAEGRDGHPNVKAMDDADWAALQDLLMKVWSALSPLRLGDKRTTILEWAKRHQAAIKESMRPACGMEGDGAAELEAVFARLIEHGHLGLPIDYQGYAGFFDQIVSNVPVRGNERDREGLRILGLLEARLLHFDTVVVAGLDEGVWPPKTRADPFLNRSMRARLGMSSPERRIGQTAHDLAQLLGASRAVIARSLKRDGSPTIPSRFIQRLSALAGQAQWTQAVSRGNRLVSLARNLDPRTGAPAAPPAPRPPVELRPLRLSVTRIEALRRDPYSIFAESVLRLTPLDPIDARLGARHYGTTLHGVVARFAGNGSPDREPVLSLEKLTALANDAFRPFFCLPGFREFSWPKLLRILAAYHRWESARAQNLVELLQEQSGLLEIPLDDGAKFALTARADRIERHIDGAICVLDFKSGALPSPREILAGFAPQLVLEAWMLGKGAFKSVRPKGPITAAYVKLGGPSDLEERLVGGEKRPLDQLASEQFDGLKALLNQLRRPETAFVSRPYPQFLSRYGPYDHLARVKEWSDVDSGGDAT